MKFEEILPGLLAGRRARLWGKRERLYSFGDDVRAADREYLRIGKGELGDLEIVAEYDNPGRAPSLCIRTFTLRRNTFERDDWEFVDDEKPQGKTK
jgi:hypothetical protein